MFDPVSISAILGLGNTIIDRLFPDKTEAAKKKIELMQAQQNGELKQLELQMSAIVMEAKSADPWTSRARPSFLYVMYILILFAIPMGILSVFQPEVPGMIATGMKAWLEAIPEALWWTFGAGYLGYTGARTFGDKKQVNELFKGVKNG